ncbi:Rv0361 family membrane protein [Catelliglobosispora koreensis]|uniref:Rv0361 family membrane protein n=1 Tax=Catelliglobosispora koreensis TaxID=129052 RepID=UPI0012FAB123|nr:hypothetical protein [Catelliglobosispora koreensis]
MTSRSQPVPRRRRGRSFLIFAAIVAGLCCAGSILGGTTVYSSVKDTIEVRNAAEQFLTRLKSGADQSGYDLLCEATKQRFTVAQYREYMFSQPAFATFEITGSSVDGDTATVTAFLQQDNGKNEPRDFPLDRQPDGAWKVCGKPY